jgi:hypothetical protein
MNRYGELLMNQLKTADPSRFRQIPDPESFFEQRGEELESEIQTLTAALAGADRPGETYLEKVARLTTARTNAESDLTREYLVSEADEEETPLRPEWQPLSRADSPEDDLL